MNSLFAKLNQIVTQDKQIEYNVTCATDGELKDHFFGRDSLALRLYSLLVLAKRGREREPMVSYDPDLNVMLNAGRYFTVDIGKYFDKQRQKVVSAIMDKSLGTMLLTNQYGVQEAKQRARLWTLSYSYAGGILRARAVFGRFHIMPMLPYEIVGVATVTRWIAEQIGAKHTEITWFFHELMNVRAMDFPRPDETKPLTVLPAPMDVSELLRMESKIREDTPKVNPIPMTPLPAELEEMQNDIFNKFCT